ncbi:DUF6191 domain-containing protein [Kitasatospora sp. NPDC057965]|uniref:DUF6191 domain-containing protein n=1 Tax=Kitasatospora sp. NPDC057965 TaxID=3346291 RepID=UPI0036D895FA
MCGTLVGPGMVVVTVALVVAALVTALFAVAAVRSGRRRRSRAGTVAGGLGMTAVEELHAFFNANKRVQIEQRQARLVLRDDEHAGAPPGAGVDLDAGVAMVRGRGKTVRPRTR